MELLKLELKYQSDVDIQNDINLGITFKERNNGIRNLQPFEGDVLLEGKMG